MSQAPAFSVIDEQKFKAFHWRAIVTTGLGVFCDGYDLSSIGIVLPLVLASFGIAKIGGLDAGLLTGSALVGAAVGALIFGVLGQKGRKRFYGLDVMLMGIMAIAQAFAPNLEWLIAIRFILGIGIGADYVLSPTIMAEHANRADRGKTLGIGFGVMWPLGAFTAAILNLVLAGLGFSHDLQWRIVLAAGAVPAFSVLYLRRRMPENGALPCPPRCRSGRCGRRHPQHQRSYCRCARRGLPAFRPGLCPARTTHLFGGPALARLRHCRLFQHLCHPELPLLCLLRA